MLWRFSAILHFGATELDLPLFLLYLRTAFLKVHLLSPSKIWHFGSRKVTRFSLNLPIPLLHPTVIDNLLYSFWGFEKKRFTSSPECGCTRGEVRIFVITTNKQTNKQGELDFQFFAKHIKHICHLRTLGFGNESNLFWFGDGPGSNLRGFPQHSRKNASRIRIKLKKSPWAKNASCVVA